MVYDFEWKRHVNIRQMAKELLEDLEHGLESVIPESLTDIEMHIHIMYVYFCISLHFIMPDDTKPLPEPMMI